MTNFLLCPFCDGIADPQGWLCNDGSRGPECEKCGATTPTELIWNTRPGEKHLREALTECLVILETVLPENNWDILRKLIANVERTKS